MAFIRFFWLLEKVLSFMLIICGFASHGWRHDCLMTLCNHVAPDTCVWWCLAKRVEELLIILNIAFGTSLASRETFGLWRKGVSVVSQVAGNRTKFPSDPDLALGKGNLIDYKINFRLPITFLLNAVFCAMSNFHSTNTLILKLMRKNNPTWTIKPTVTVSFIPVNQNTAC